MKDGVEAIGFMRKERVVEDGYHNRGRKFAVPLAFEKRLGKEPRPVIQNPLRHIVLVNDLNFHVDPLASVGSHEHIKPVHFSLFYLFCQLRVFKLHINNPVMACPMQNRIQKAIVICFRLGWPNNCLNIKSSFKSRYSFITGIILSRRMWGRIEVHLKKSQNH